MRQTQFMLKKGLFIVFEGIDGAGKSTQAKLLSSLLFNMGYNIHLTREPSDSIWGKKIRELASRKDYNLSPEEELELFIKDREHHVKEVITPYIEKKFIVITDRYYFSTIAYQGALGIDKKLILKASENVPKPDLVFYLKIPPKVGINRIKSKRKEPLTCFEEVDYLQKVSSIFDTFNEDFFHKIEASDETIIVTKKIKNLSLDIILKHTERN